MRRRLLFAAGGARVFALACSRSLAYSASGEFAVANARSQFDMISGYLQRTHEAQAGLLYGKPCITFNNNAFAAFQADAVAFRLHGRVLAQALGMAGVRGWDPLHAQRSAPGWVLVPATHVLRWNWLALEALRCAREASERRISYAVDAVAPVGEQAPPEQPSSLEPAAPPSNAQSLAQRVSAAVASGFRSLTLSDVD
jgi:hypothetical protein